MRNDDSFSDSREPKASRRAMKLRRSRSVARSAALATIEGAAIESLPARVQAQGQAQRLIVNHMYFPSAAISTL